MKRHAAHFVYCNPQRIIPNGIVEIDNKGIITQFLSLNDFPEEIHSTIFHNGIIVPPVFEGIDFTVLQHKSLFPVLDALFLETLLELKENSFAEFYLLRNIDLSQKRFSPNCTLEKLC